MEGEVDTDSIYGSAADGLRGFQRFLEPVEACPGLLRPRSGMSRRRIASFSVLCRDTKMDRGLAAFTGNCLEQVTALSRNFCNSERQS